MMLHAIWQAASGMSARQVQLDLTAHDLANMQTSGYKRSHVTFRSLLRQELSPQLTGEVRQGSGVRAHTGKDWMQGAFQQTGQPLDVALDGSGFLVVRRPDGSRAYTRDGHLQVDAGGVLVSTDGSHILSTDGDRIQIDRGFDAIEIRPDGWIEVTAGQDKTQVAQVGVAVWNQRLPLRAVGDNLYETVDGSDLPLDAPGARAAVQLRPGFLEQSNVDLSQGMLNLVEAQRAYQFQTRVIQTADSILAMANRLASNA